MKSLGKSSLIAQLIVIVMLLASKGLASEPEPTTPRLQFFYQVNCPACKRQLSQLGCLSAHDKSQLDLFGVGDDKLRLKQLAQMQSQVNYQHLSFQKASRSWQINATPTWVLANGSKRSYSHEVMPCETIRKYLTATNLKG